MASAPHRVKINDVASMYGLERAEKRLVKMKLLYVRNDKGPAPSTKPTNLFLAGMVQAARGRGDIVLTERDVVNRFGPSFDKLDYVRNEKALAASTTSGLLELAGVVQKARGLGRSVLTDADVVNRFGPSFDRLDDGPTAPLPGLGTVTR